MTDQIQGTQEGATSKGQMQTELNDLIRTNKHKKNSENLTKFRI